LTAPRYNGTGPLGKSVFARDELRGAGRKENQVRYRQVRVIGGKGLAADQFRETLRGIDIGRGGLIHAVGDSELKVFSPTGSLHRRWATERPGFSVEVDEAAEATVYVGQDGQVQRFEASGRLTATWRDGDRLGVVTAIGAFEDHVLMADATHRCIRRYDKTGKFVNDIGRRSGRKGFLIPNGHLDFFVDTRGIIHAANPGKHRVERYTLEGELLGYIGRFGGPDPAGFSGCCNPTNLARAPKGAIVVTEKAPPRIKVYDAEGNLLSIIDGGGFDPNCKNMDVAIDLQGRIHVVDTVRLQICVFAPADTPKPEKAAEGASKR